MTLWLRKESFWTSKNRIWTEFGESLRIEDAVRLWLHNCLNNNGYSLGTDYFPSLHLWLSISDIHHQRDPEERKRAWFMEWWICGQINNDLFSTTYLKYFWYEFGKKIPEIDFVKRIVAIIMRTARRDHRIEIRIWRAVKSNTFEFPSQTVHNQSVRQCNAMQKRIHKIFVFFFIFFLKYIHSTGIHLSESVLNVLNHFG